MDVSRTPQEPSAPDPVVYVEELAAPGDYWLSLTDASRVCRVQDVSIRRAIARGVLPVRRQRAGQNKRTRFVRASDLAPAGFPIIDESAAISTEIGKVDVLSIPRQQQQIVQEHQELVLRLDETRETLKQQWQEIAAELQRQQEHSRASQQAAREEQARLLAAAETRFAQEQEKLRQALSESAHSFTAEQKSLRGSLAEAREQAERFQAALETLDSNLTHTQAEARELIADLVRDLAQERADSLLRQEHVLTIAGALQNSVQEHQQAVQRQFAEQAEAQRALFSRYQQAVDAEFQRREQATSGRMQALEQALTEHLHRYEHTIDERIAEHLHVLTRTFEAQVAGLAQTLAQVQQSTEQMLAREHACTQTLLQQQEQLDQHEQRVSSLQQRLPPEQNTSFSSQALADLKARFLSVDHQAQQRAST